MMDKKDDPTGIGARIREERARRRAAEEKAAIAVQVARSQRERKGPAGMGSPRARGAAEALFRPKPA